MRLHHLTMTAIGPYAGTETIDFDRLSSSGRFLLAGPTGSGKSTIIDAIVFALYGEVAGDKDSSKDRMRSRLVGPDTPSVVELTFSTSAGTYRVRRTPAYERAKRRGTGTTQQNATVKVWRLSGPDGEQRHETALRPEEAGAELRRAIGLTRDQFTQTIVLPQGKFARFLRASSTERHEVLREVFGTHLYDDVQDWLVARSREVAAQVDQARAQARSALSQLGSLLQPEHGQDQASRPDQGEGAPSSPDQDAPGSPGHNRPDQDTQGSQDTLDALARAIERTDPDLNAVDATIAELDRTLQERSAVLDRAVEQADRARQAARERVEEATSLERRLQRRRRLLAERDRIAEQEPVAAGWREELDAARRAAAVAPYMEAFDRLARQAHTAVEEAGGGQRARAEQDAVAADEQDAVATDEQDAVAAELTAALRAATSVGSTSAPAGRPLDLAQTRARALALRQAAADRRTHAGSLSHAADLEEQLPQRAATLAAARADQEQEARALAGTRQQLADLPQQRAEVQAALARARDAALATAQQRQVLEEATAVSEAADQVEPARARMEQAGRARADAAQAATGAEEEAHRLRRVWIAATASTLVSELEEGRPCPVCGATEHPAPAPMDHEAVSRTDVEAAEAQAAAAREQLTRAAADYQDAQARLERAREASRGMSPQEAQEQVRRAAATLSSTTQQAEQVEVLEAQEQQLVERASTLQAELAATQARLAGRGESLTRMEQELDAARQEVERARQGHDTVAQRLRELTDLAEADEEQAAALAAAVETLTRTGEAADQLTQALAEQELSSTSQAAQAARTADQTRQLEEACRAYTQQRDALAAALAEPELARLTGQEEPDVQAATVVSQEADAAWHRATTTQARGEERASAVLAAAARLRDRACELAQVVAGSAPLIAVTALARGENLRSTPLASWVLAERFQDVMSFANGRLAHMSSGRYQLVPLAEERHGGRRRGLGLGVRDLLGGGVRDPRTLSGGESFYVSLALALALADVVSAEAGGVRMDTLFIDEGFGSLDPETLDAVLAELTRLEQDGRLVGIVSHVAELRAQIPDQILVTVSPSGSHLRVTGQ